MHKLPQYSLLSVMLLAAFISVSARAADIKILKYDSKGNPIGVERVDPRMKSNKGTESGANRNAPSTGLLREDSEVEPNQVLIISRAQRLSAQVRSLGFTLLEEVELESLQSNLLVLRTPRGMGLNKAIGLLRQRFPRATIDKNHRLNPSGAGTSPQPDYSKKMIGWGKVPLTCGANLRLGMIDGMPDVTHPLLKGQRVVTKAFIRDGLPAVMDHSTSIASILVGKPYRKHPGGLLPGATLYAGGIFRRMPDGSRKGSLLAFFKALNWMSKQRVSVVNVSLVTANNKVMQKIMQQVVNNGQVLIASASNKGPRAKTPYPAGYRQVISVTAIDRKWQVFHRASHGEFLDFAAPGVDLVLTRGKGFAKRSGTSYSTPFITGLAAILIQSGNPPDPDLLRGKLRRYALDLGRKGHDPVYGYGVVRARPPC